MKKKQGTGYISQEMVRKSVSNTYEAVMVTARAARQLNLQNQMVGTEDDRSDKVTSLALQHLLNNKIKYTIRTKTRSSEN
jgi:DNA-directed RNA polymerase omega subunit